MAYPAKKYVHIDIRDTLIFILRVCVTVFKNFAVADDDIVIYLTPSAFKL